jgi:hypothetical protein
MSSDAHFSLEQRNDVFSNEARRPGEGYVGCIV